MQAQAVKIACERPDVAGRSLSQWDCREIARTLTGTGVVASVSVETVRRWLARHKLKPWRKQMWLSPKVARDEAFAARVQTIADLYTRALADRERVLCLDEKTSLQPRPRLSPTLPCAPGQPTRVEHEYKRDGALHLFAAFDTRTGQVIGQTASRKRQVELLSLLEQIDRETPDTVTTLYVVLDNVRMHTGKAVQAWLALHPRFVWVHPPVHCSWLNQIEQWFGLLQRKRFGVVDFASKAALAERIQAFIAEWNAQTHAFAWSVKSFEKVLAKCQAQVQQAQAGEQSAPVPT